MKKSEFNRLFREYVKNHLSPTKKERSFVAKVYQSIQVLLGEGNCLQIGSYPRFTAITPLHDLDVLYIVGKWNNNVPDPAAILDYLRKRIEADYKNPTEYKIRVLLQTHSITVLFLQGNEEVFSVDIVPAYIFGKNEFGSDMYMVPEILSQSHRRRKLFYEELARSDKKMNLIKSDPKGYIEVTNKVNEKNPDFRKSVKFVKAWRSSCIELNEAFKLKSFHIEQIITQYFIQDIGLEIFDAIFNFFCDLPNFIKRSQIPDRADASKKIDDYIDDLTEAEKQLIIQARDFFLIKLEAFSEDSSVADLLKGGFRKRASNTEAYLFDSQIPTLIEKDAKMNIIGRVLQREGGFREKFLSAIGLIEVDRRIEFRLVDQRPIADIYKWKVKNDDRSKDPRGEITNHTTRNDPEHTKYNGEHFVECYAIKDGVCIARAKQNVVLSLPFGKR